MSARSPCRGADSVGSAGHRAIEVRQGVALSNRFGNCRAGQRADDGGGECTPATLQPTSPRVPNGSANDKTACVSSDSLVQRGSSNLRPARHPRPNGAERRRRRMRRHQRAIAIPCTQPRGIFPRQQGRRQGCTVQHGSSGRCASDGPIALFRRRRAGPGSATSSLARLPCATVGLSGA